MLFGIIYCPPPKRSGARYATVKKKMRTQTINRIKLKNYCSVIINIVRRVSDMYMGVYAICECTNSICTCYIFFSELSSRGIWIFPRLPLETLPSATSLATPLSPVPPIIASSIPSLSAYSRILSTGLP